ncbi:MAG: hypothetical protein ACI8ZB_003812 [Desulforhopalus sp.]|jgi:hypothetical protein
MLNQGLVDDLNLLFADELESVAKALGEGERTKWACPIVTTEVGEYLVVPLLTSKKVKSEGYLMQNCIREYIPRCIDGTYLVFSIRSGCGERVATLGARDDGGYWVFDDCLGNENEPVIEIVHECCDVDGSPLCLIDYTEIFSVAHEVVRLLNLEERNYVVLS